jgi:hypothetical protein
MKKIAIILIVFIAFISCKNKTTEVVEEADTITETKTEEASDWIPLFDGSSYDNWRGYLAESTYPEWTIEDNAMTFTPGESGGKNIISKEQFNSFILSLEWKISEGGNSGIFWGVHEDTKFPEAYETGPEIQVLDNKKHPDAFVGEGRHTAGALYDMIAPSEDMTNPAGEWNLCVIEVNHTTNSGKVTLNGTEIVNFPVHGDKWDAMVANSKFKDWAGFGKYPTGHIGLQDHGDRVWYRNIKIKKLE